MTDDKKKPDRSTLETLPDRASRFLRGVAHNAHVRSALASAHRRAGCGRAHDHRGMVSATHRMNSHGTYAT